MPNDSVPIDIGADIASASHPPPDATRSKLTVRTLDFYYRGYHALKNINLDIPERQVTAIIGPSGCGKSTLLRVFNRIYSVYAGLEATGQVMLDGENILDPQYSLNRLRTRVGMVFQKAVPFPLSIFENVAFGLRHHIRLSRVEMDDRVSVLRGHRQAANGNLQGRDQHRPRRIRGRLECVEVTQIESLVPERRSKVEPSEMVRHLSLLGDLQSRYFS